MDSRLNRARQYSPSAASPWALRLCSSRGTPKRWGLLLKSKPMSEPVRWARSRLESSGPSASPKLSSSRARTTPGESLSCTWRWKENKSRSRALGWRRISGLARPRMHRGGEGSDSSHVSNSPSSRDLPIPASPLRVMRWLPSPARTASRAERNWRISSSRPTIRAQSPSRPRPREERKVRGRAVVTRYTWSGSCLPLRRSGGHGSPTKSPLTWRQVPCDTRTPSTGAACSNRLAVLTVSPITVCSPSVPTTPSSAGPVWMPMRMCRPPAGAPEREGSWARISSAACRAWAGSSSRAPSAPQSAMTASPMCLSMRPPWRRIAESTRAQSRFISSPTSSGSICSLSEVNPQTSPKSTVTWRRSRGTCEARAASRACRAPSAASVAAAPSRGRCASSTARACSSSSRSSLMSAGFQHGARGLGTSPAGIPHSE